MKRFIVLLAIACLAETMTGQPNPSISATADSAVTPPPAVTTAFATRFPAVQVKKWTEAKETYIAYFRLDRKKIFAYFAPDGSWKATEYPVKWLFRLPDVVKKGLRKSEYAAWRPLDLKKVETPGQTLYALHVDDWNLLDSDHAYFSDEYELFFNEKGVLVRKDAK